MEDNTTDMLYEIFINEYNSEQSRTGLIDQKTSIVVSIIGIYLVFLLNNLPAQITSGIVIFYGIALLCSLVAFGLLMMAMIRRKYLRFDLNGYLKLWDNREKSKNSLDDGFLQKFLKDCKEMVNNNRKNNDVRMGYYHYSLFFIVASIGCLIIYLVLCQLTIGV